MTPPLRPLSRPLYAYVREEFVVRPAWQKYFDDVNWHAVAAVVLGVFGLGFALGWW